MDTKKDILGMKVSGNIISELSDRIPSNFMALNELIKNAYDADATVVNVDITTSEKQIVFQDNGCGMDRTSMENLLHIARSNKNYSVERANGRITQGEKGLGALATFHFGNNVTWETSQNGSLAYRFTVLKNEIIEKDDINEYKTFIEEISASFKGTKISIDDIPDEEFEFLIETLRNKKTTAKLVRSLYDSSVSTNFIVNLRIDNSTCVNEEDLLIDERNNEERIYRVEYDSSGSDNTIKYYYKDILVLEEKYVLDKMLSDFIIKCKLNIYDLGGKVSNAHFPSIYHKEQEKPDITPLVYINQGFFKNYTLFDVDIVRQTSSGSSLPQMTGEIEIRTQSDKLMFNADRTEINENVITAKLKTEIERLNKTIQKAGADYKQPFIEMNRGRLPAIIIKSKRLDITNKGKKEIETVVANNITNKVYAKLATYKVFEDRAIYSFFNNDIEVKLIKQEDTDNGGEEKPTDDKPRSGGSQPPNGNGTIKPAVISLTTYDVEITIERTGQINLYDFVIQEETKDSTGKQIPLDKISIQDDKGLMKASNILPAIETPQELKITYSYNDNQTGSEFKVLTLVFVEPRKSPMKGTSNNKPLIHTHGIGGFEVSFDNVVPHLVNQINSLKTDDYKEVIACSLRTLFELGIDAIKNKNTSSTNLKSLQNSLLPKNKSLEGKVKEVVSFVKPKKNREFIAKYLSSPSCPNVSFDTLNNIANVDRISTNAGESNLGAHKGTTNLSLPQIIDIANSASAFLIFVEGIVGAADNF